MCYTVHLKHVTHSTRGSCEAETQKIVMFDANIRKPSYRCTKWIQHVTDLCLHSCSCVAYSVCTFVPVS